MEIKTIGVVGAGQMGNGIAQVAAHSGFRVVMSDIADSFVQKGLGTISKNLGEMVEKGKTSSREEGRDHGKDQRDHSNERTWPRPILWWRQPRRMNP